MKIHNPKLLLPLKDTIIVSVSCGYSFSLAITITRNVVAWGDNSYNQLGLGEYCKEDRVLVPT